MYQKRFFIITTISVFMLAVLWIGQATLTSAAYLQSVGTAVSPLQIEPQNVAGGTVTLTETVKLTSTHEMATGSFGRAVALHEDTLVVAQTQGIPNGIDTVGILYVYERHVGGFNQWGVTKVITASDNTTGLGDFLAFDSTGNTLIAGAGGADGNTTDSGAAYIFERNHGGANNWGEVAKLIAPDGANGDRFGWSVAIDADTAVVGARWHTNVNTDDGSAYIFERNQGGANNWGFVTELSATNPATNAWFGYAVAVEGDTIVVGQDNRTSTAFRGGYVHIYERNLGGINNWGKVRHILPSTPASSARFGNQVDLDGDRLVVGAIDLSTSRTGGVYIFERNEGGADNWGEIIELRPSDGAANDVFGSSVQLRDDTLFIGARGATGNANDTGAAYIFKQSPGNPRQWDEIEKLIPSDGGAADEFGRNVAFWDETYVVGSFHHDAFCPGDPSCDSGAAYIFGAADPADVTIEKHVSTATAVPSQPITYTLTYTNNGPAIAYNTIITDIVPPTIINPAFSSSGPLITPTMSSTFVWDVAPLSVGESGIITITGMISSGLATDTIISNTAVITNQIDITPTNNVDTAVVTISVPQSQSLYLPLVVKPAPTVFPIQIGEAIAIEPTMPGVTFYTATIAMPSNIPATGQFFLSAQPDQISPIWVDDELVISLNNNELFTKLFSPSCQPVQAESVEVPRTIIEQLAGESPTITYRDVCGNNVGASAVWLIWAP